MFGAIVADVILVVAHPSKSGKPERIFLALAFFTGLIMVAHGKKEGPVAEVRVGRRTTAFSLTFILILAMVVAVCGAILFPVFAQA